MAQIDFRIVIHPKTHLKNGFSGLVSVARGLYCSLVGVEYFVDKVDKFSCYQVNAKRFVFNYLKNTSKCGLSNFINLKN